MDFVKNKLNSKVIEQIVYIGLTLTSIALSFVISNTNIKVGSILIFTFVGLPIVFFLFTNIKFTFFFALTLSFFISLLQRISNGLISSFVVEIILWFILLSLIISQIRTRKTKTINWSHLNNPITIALLVWTVFIHLQLFNPNSSSIVGKLIAIRLSWFNIIGFVLALTVFTSIRDIRLFLKVILGVSLIAGLYGLSQKYIGLLRFDHDWIYSSPERMQLGVIWGQLRAWAFLNDPANFGLLMGFSSVICFSLMTGPYKLYQKIILGCTGLVLLLAMISSGTRTAFVMVPAGLGVFGLLTLNNFKTVFLSVCIALAFLALYFGPFYSAPVLRFRSAFQGNEDASMNFRSENKKKIRPYIYSHPIGGGPNTTGEVGRTIAKGHPLAGFPPDSNALRIALELGYIGLVLILLLYYRVSSKAVSLYFSTKDPEKKTIYIAILCSFISLCIADLTQLATTAKPFDFIIFSYFAILVKLEKMT